MNFVRNKSLKQLLWIGIASIVMFFAGITSAYVVRKPQGNWIEIEGLYDEKQFHFLINFF